MAIIDELDKVQPATGEMIPSQPEAYLAANHLWDAGSKTIRQLSSGTSGISALTIFSL